MTTLPNYPPAVDLAGTDIIPVWQDGSQKSATTDQVLKPGLDLMQEYVGADIQLTWVALEAVTGSADRNAVVPNDPGNHTDPVTNEVVPNSGFYKWDATALAWHWISETQASNAAASAKQAKDWAESDTAPDPDDPTSKSAKTLAAEAAISAAAAASPSVFTSDNTFFAAIRDNTNLLGGGANALYVPRIIYFKRGTEAQYNITVANAAASEIAGGNYCKLSLDAANVSYVWLDLTDNTIKVEVYASGLNMHTEKGNNLIQLAVARGKFITSSRLRIFEADDLLEGAITFKENCLILEKDGKLLVPAYWSTGFGSATWTARDPVSDGSRYVEIDTAAIGHVARIYHDGLAADAGTTFVKRAYDGAAGSHAGFKSNDIATVSGYNVKTQHAIAGAVPGGSVSNQCPFGKASIDAMPRNFAPTNVAATTITDANLTALGFTRGFTRLTGAGDIFVGMDLPDARRGGSIFIREYVYTDVAGSFGIPRAYLWSATSTSPLMTFNLTLEKKISDNVAIYSGTFDFPDVAGAVWLYMGTTVTAGTMPIVTGFQFHHSGERARWIMRDDYPSAQAVDADIFPIIGQDLFVVSDRPTILYPAQMFANREGFDPPSVMLESRQGLPTQPLVLGPVKDAPLVIDYARCGTAAYMRWYPAERRDRVIQKVITVKKKAVPVTGSPARNILMIGDSLPTRQQAYFANILLSAWGFAVNWIGTMNGNGSGNAAGTGPLGEGREGWALSDFLMTRQDSDVTSIVTAGGEAAYQALSNTAKLAVNPFLQLAASSSSAATTITYGGQSYKFDLAYYLSRFSLATPDIVVLNLSKNDQLELAAAAAISDVTTLYPMLLAEIRRAMPSAKILCWGTVMPDSYTSNTGWYSAGAPILRVIRDAIKARRDAGDANIWFVPTHAMHSIGDFNTPMVTDATTGTMTGTVGATNTDIIHPPVPTTITSGVGREQIAEALAVAIACVA
ncbi:SGNH/GDSL hydrolase family protein [Novosphingobium sp. KA1]|uniref:SGNH/GDSL hydrolase family protein n=1 Tax=Novosphingobium sp. (strain KA1) TaxID=164608 RepID=UPI001A8DE68F|nr:SGNH/GDSL hydrolase family protein [Novosphingobium sp. KA1]QSR16081.1 hypothetical protein CA833_02520 [Novosphingobium sp. KA1]